MANHLQVECPERVEGPLSASQFNSTLDDGIVADQA